MEDVALAAGVAKGTLYLYVESKEAMFDLALRFALGDAVDELLPELPLRGPPSTRRFERIQRELTKHGDFGLSSRPARNARAHEVEAEARKVCELFFDRVQDNRVGLKLVDRCARDLPELGALWYEQRRDDAQRALAAWLRARRSRLRPGLDPELTARFVLETIAFWAMHRHWDPLPPPGNEAEIRSRVVSLLVGALVVES